MARIHCHYLDCLFLDGKYCSAAAIELDPDNGCKTYQPNEEVDLEDWDTSEELDEWDDGEDNEDLWVDDEEDDLLSLEIDEEDEDF